MWRAVRVRGRDRLQGVGLPRRDAHRSTTGSDRGGDPPRGVRVVGGRAKRWSAGVGAVGGGTREPQALLRWRPRSRGGDCFLVLPDRGAGYLLRAAGEGGLLWRGGRDPPLRGAVVNT